MTTRGTTALPRLGGDAPACLLADVRGISANSEVVSSWRERGTWVLADTAWDEAGAWDPVGLEALRVADVCTPNEEEALAYARTDSVEDAARWFASFGCDCVVTCGKNGVIACVDGRILRVPAPAVNAVDTTGAGDVFSAALAWARQARRMSWPEALALACAAGRTLHAGDRRILVGTLRGRPPGCVRSPTGPLPRHGAKSRYDRRMTDSSSTPTQAPADDTPEQVKVRAAKRARLMEAGIPAYPVRLPITTTIKAVREKYAHLEPGEETEDYVGLAGRVILARNGGKLCFATLMDGEGNKIQVMLSAASVGAESLAAYKNDVDLGDHLFVHGRVISSRRGELSIFATPAEVTPEAQAAYEAASAALPAPRRLLGHCLPRR